MIQKQFANLQVSLIQKEYFLLEKNKKYTTKYLINLMRNLLNIESLLKKGNNPINVFIENLINLS